MAFKSPSPQTSIKTMAMSHYGTDFMNEFGNSPAGLDIFDSIGLCEALMYKEDSIIETSKAVMHETERKTALEVPVEQSQENDHQNDQDIQPF